MNTEANTEDQMFLNISNGEILTTQYIIIILTNINSNLTKERARHNVLNPLLTNNKTTGHKTIMCNTCANTDSLGFPFDR